MLTSRSAGSFLGQRLQWFIAAILVLLSSGVVGVWLNATALRSDRDVLSRGADALELGVEEQLRVLELGGVGTRTIIDQDLPTELALGPLMDQIDYTVLSSLLGVLWYPSDEIGTEQGQFLLLGAIGIPDFDAPELVVGTAEIEELDGSGDRYFTEPFVTLDPDRLDYLMAMAFSEEGERAGLIGVVLRPDQIVENALEAAGEGQYTATLVDARVDGEVVLSMGEPSSPLEEVRRPFGANNPVELVIQPGADFHFAQSPWIVVMAVATGVVIATLLVWMGHMANARSESLAERLRLAQELNEGKDRFLATVSHELRTPLTVVLGIASEMGSRWDLFGEEEREDLMTMMAEQAVEAANIVEDLLVAARSDPSRLRLAMERTSLEPHITYAIGSLPDEGRHRVVSHASDLPVYADTTRLRQILRNVLENAVRHGGREISVDALSNGRSMTVVIADNGDLDGGDVERIFEPYEQTAVVASETLTGVGIGLYVSRLLAQLMGGDLDCVREKGWTKFRLTLPSNVADAAPDPDVVASLF